MNNGNREDNMEIVRGGGCLVIQCGHCSEAKVQWIETKEGNPPDLLFSGFPASGRVMLAKKAILLACERCKGQLDVIQEEYARTLVL